MSCNTTANKQQYASPPETAIVSAIQRFSLHDGPGIRTLVFLKGCLLRCPWCQNPESQDLEPTIGFYESSCDATLACASVCPRGAIRKSGFRIDYTLCDSCAKCVDACGQNALRRIGERMTAEDLMRKITADLPYFQQSNGGVTLTGGEATLHREFLITFAEICQRKHIHLTLETNGFFSFDKLQGVLRKIPLIYYDLKIIDAPRHREIIGVENALILENALRLAKGKFSLEFRFLPVEGLTDARENLSALRDFLHEARATKLHLLKYHSMGEAKISIINGAQPYLGLSAYPEEKWNQIADFFDSSGIQVQ